MPRRRPGNVVELGEVTNRREGGWCGGTQPRASAPYNYSGSRKQGEIFSVRDLRQTPTRALRPRGIVSSEVGCRKSHFLLASVSTLPLGSPLLLPCHSRIPYQLRPGGHAP